MARQGIVRCQPTSRATNLPRHNHRHIVAYASLFPRPSDYCLLLHNEQHVDTDLVINPDYSNFGLSSFTAGPRSVKATAQLLL